MRRILIYCSIFSTVFAISCSQAEDIERGEIQDSFGDPVTTPKEPEAENQPACLKSLYFNLLKPIQAQVVCDPANEEELKMVNEGNEKKDEFLARCLKETGGSCWCDQLVRPNPESINNFHCTYGEDQVHQLIHPDESTWAYAYEAVKIVEEFEKINLNTRIIYNWWRPEPYNGNVGGSPTRHPFGTSVDIRFETKEMQEDAFLKLCEMRKEGRIRAIGYYATTAIHIGVGDHRANTWGKLCP